MKLAAFLSSTPSKPVAFKKAPPPVSALQKDWVEKCNLETTAIDEKAINYFRTLAITTCVTEGRVKKPDIDPFFVCHAFRQGLSLPVASALDILKQATDIMTFEPNTLSLTAPLIIVGDLHGQFFDLLHLLHVHGDPGPTNQYLFLGDYVDRGPSSSEIMLLLLAYKIKFPLYVHLLRGNHECRSVSTHYGFREECWRKYGLLVYSRMISCFESMPLAATIETDYGVLLALHGGLSPEIQTIDEINDLDRFVEPKPSGALCDLLWSDPSKDKEQNEEWAPNPVRGCSYLFSEQLVRSFLKRNNLLAIIRAHEMEEAGHYEHYTSNISLESFPPVVTVFSAPEYCGVYQNMGATLFLTFEWHGHLDFVQHKRSIAENCVYVENEGDAIENFLASEIPFLPMSFPQLVTLCSKVGPGLHVVQAVATPSQKAWKKISLLTQTTNMFSQWMKRKQSIDVEKPLPVTKPKPKPSEPRSNTGSSRGKRSSNFTPPSEINPAAVKAAQQKEIACIKVSSRIAELQNQIFQSVTKSGLPMCQPTRSLSNVDEDEESEEEEEVHSKAKERSRSFHEYDLKDSRVAQIRRAWQTKVNEETEKKLGPLPDPRSLQRRPSVEKLQGQIDIVNALQAWEGKKETKPKAKTEEVSTKATIKKQLTAESFTTEEWRALKLYFAIVTRDDNAQLTKKKLGQLLEDQDKDAYATQDELSTIIGAMDSDEDGVIGEADFLYFAYRAKEHSLHAGQRHTLTRRLSD
ncbi:unnamed protein product [Aphanomyces euteiches]|uniref:Serine/threonine-protein phosphatase n=1 Tax=Aphanomyces euteiches TaxID=100861 RepID=A0A6G0XTR3_9STRA|nr:hypothetical protein Ae201684_001443 [Aphanomyces euteiches]KAH9075032.1 hypothetical protein Ae201684P_003717 [Aphanomyces euteiches]KAH9141312.1 hypothetical protein AeRB84_014513 [Aphanomyces euteiches]KAH9142346.1 hypothetical protein AeRB84_013615 [Aphanomyces euteiches]KAH9146489.1 hypothetical protein AeRB84_009594 [Aphanomyces euteiches]